MLLEMIIKKVMYFKANKFIRMDQKVYNAVHLGYLFVIVQAYERSVTWVNIFCGII